jgi:MSHA biogenesis protein MshO
MNAMPFPAKLRRLGGFTLVEVVIVMVVTGVLAGIVAIFIKGPVLNYINARSRAEMSDAADGALRRMRRDVRLALPNSIRVSSDGRALEFIQTKVGARYLSIEDGAAPGRFVLNFITAAPPDGLRFDIVGTPPVGAQAIVQNDRVVVYNLGSGFAPADAYTGGNIATVAGIAGQTVTLTANPFAAQAAQGAVLESPGRRFQVITGPVSYYCRSFANGGNGTIERHHGYALQANQPYPPSGPVVAVLASNVQACSFTYNTTMNEPKALVGIALTLRDRRDDTTRSTLSLHVHVDNTP